MVYYTGLLFSCSLIGIILSDDSETKIVDASVFVMLPIYGRIFGWW